MAEGDLDTVTFKGAAGRCSSSNSSPRSAADCRDSLSCMFQCHTPRMAVDIRPVILLRRRRSWCEATCVDWRTVQTCPLRKYSARGSFQPDRSLPLIAATSTKVHIVEGNMLRLTYTALCLTFNMALVLYCFSITVLFSFLPGIFPRLPGNLR